MTALPDLLLTNTGRGLAVHLRADVEPEEPAALCGVAAPFLETSTWFALNGCMKCARRAVRLGYSRVVDIDGEPVELDGFVNASHEP
ncbi:hypothetical protein [Kutzneria buriramensis]|uniref:hypothetical protein n=1 Tax=Kutzneria buriramensis TaxID=1045776 RepID=UPI0035EBFA42